MSIFTHMNYSFLNKNIHLFDTHRQHENPCKMREIINKCYHYATLRSKIPQDINGYAYMGAFILSSCGNVYSIGYNKL